MNLQVDAGSQPVKKEHSDTQNYEIAHEVEKSNSVAILTSPLWLSQAGKLTANPLLLTASESLLQPRVH